MDKIQIGLSKKRFETKPDNTVIQKYLTKDYEVIETDVNGLMEYLLNGHAITSVFQDRSGKFYRSGKYFKQSDLIILDFDNSDATKYLSYYDAIQDDFIKQNAYMAYTTLSHNSEPDYIDKFRIIFKLPDTCKDVNEYTKYIKAMLSKFPEADKSCKDSARFYFGTKQDADYEIFRNTLPAEILQQIVNDYEAIEALKPKYVTSQELTPSIQDELNIFPDSNNRFIRISINLIAKSKDKEKWSTLRTASVLLGGRIASGLVDENIGREALIEAIKRKQNVKSLDDAIKVIDSAIIYGKLKPLTAEKMPYSIFPCCLLAYKSDSKNKYEFIEAIRDYTLKKPNQDVIDYIANYERQYGNDAMISIPTKILDLALTRNNNLGKSPYKTFKVASAICKFFNKASNLKHQHIKIIRRDAIRRIASGYKSKEIAPSDINTNPSKYNALTDQEIKTATKLLDEANLIYKVLDATNRNSWTGIASKFHDKDEFIEIVYWLIKDKIDNSLQKKGDAILHDRINIYKSTKIEAIAEAIPGQIIETLSKHSIYEKKYCEAVFNTTKIDYPSYEINGKTFYDVKRRNSAEVNRLLSNLQLLA